MTKAIFHKPLTTHSMKKTMVLIPIQICFKGIYVYKHPMIPFSMAVKTWATLDLGYLCMHSQSHIQGSGSTASQASARDTRFHTDAWFQSWLLMSQTQPAKVPQSQQLSPATHA